MKNKIIIAIIILLASSVITDEDGSRVLTVDDNGTLHFKRVEIGKDFGEVVEIIKGLNSQDKIVTNYNDNLKDGQKA